MSLPEHLMPLLAPISALQRLLEHLGGRGVILGGIAMGFLGKPRFTVDVDAMVLASINDIPRLLQYAKAEGIDARVENADEFARKYRVLLLCHTSSGINIDISLGILPFEEETVERSIVHKIGSLSLRLPTAEDMIIMKAVAHRLKDLQDIQEIANAHPDLDLARIERWVKSFADALGEPEMWEDVRKLIETWQ